MQCNKCGKEFGEGVICQHCGVDRVTGLAGYHGYETPSGNGSILPSSENANGITTPSRPTYASQVVEEKTMFCYACNEVIPADSDFCPVCGQKLFIVCPNCGSKYSSKFEICNKCGTNRVQFEQQRLERERIAKEERIRKEKEQKIREEKKREEERRIAEEKRQREEEERRKKKKEEKKQKEIKDCADIIIREIRKGLSEHVLFGVTYTIGMGLSVPIIFLLMIYVSPRFIILFFLLLILMFNTGKFYDYLEKQELKEKIQEYIKDHPNDPVNQYLKKEIE